MSIARLRAAFADLPKEAWDFVVADNAEHPHCQVVTDGGDRVLVEIHVADPEEQARVEFIAIAHEMMPGLLAAADHLGVVIGIATAAIASDVCDDIRERDEAALKAASVTLQALTGAVDLKAGIPEQEGSYPLVAVFSGTVADGFSIDRVLPANEAASVVENHLRAGQLAEAVAISDPATRDKAIEAVEGGEIFVIVSGGSPGDGVSVFGPFGDEDVAEDFGEDHRGEDGEWSLFVLEDEAPRAAPTGPRS